MAAPGGGHDLASADVRSASGSVLIANSRDGQAVLDAHGLRPGESESGTVTIGNRGDVRGRFAVTATGVQETAGVHGGLLSGRVQLLLVDETDPQHPVTVYAGTPAGLGRSTSGASARARSATTACRSRCRTAADPHRTPPATTASRGRR